MSNRIMLHLTGGRQAHIELCIDDGFFIPNRLCQIMTIRINDAASASAHKFRKFRYDIALTQVRRIRTASDNHISIDFHIIVAYGVSISAVTDNLISDVKYRVEEFSGMQVDKINVYIEGVRVID